MRARIRHIERRHVLFLRNFLPLYFSGTNEVYLAYFDQSDSQWRWIQERSAAPYSRGGKGFFVSRGFTSNEIQGAADFPVHHSYRYPWSFRALGCCTSLLNFEP